MEAVVILLVIIVVVAVAGVLIYNGLVQRRLRVDEAFAQIEVQLKRRHDLIPNLVNAGQGLHGLRAGRPDAGHRGPRERHRRRRDQGPAAAGRRPRTC